MKFSLPITIIGLGVTVGCQSFNERPEASQTSSEQRADRQPNLSNSARYSQVLGPIDRQTRLDRLEDKIEEQLQSVENEIMSKENLSIETKNTLENLQNTHKELSTELRNLRTETDEEWSEAHSNLERKLEEFNDDIESFISELNSPS
ncbi:MAG: hypothetical protein COV44_03605 [Deltaproteobacteria bacterium CG11_big_fil_rev_8_21_14_0_20_45_16]|nr:MAG: hypothetical protein COV44_03605 [Deltaproteobacteria bacterium CG11_big_fil_rev_8_21_14_0_20_45_16]